MLAESNFEYNQQVVTVNNLIERQDYLRAYKLVAQLERKGVFTNNDLVRMHRILSLKVNERDNQLSYRPRLLGDYVIKSLTYYQNKDYFKSVEFTKESLQENFASDTLRKLYEIIVEKTPELPRQRQRYAQQVSMNKLHLNEAMNLLDLMKRKEKTLF